jgi:WD40 repeat protein
VSGSADQSIKVWDMLLGSCVLTLTGHTFSVWSVIVLPDGRVVSGSHDNSIKVWDLLLGSCVLTLTGHTYGVWSVIVLPDGRVVSFIHRYLLICIG